MSISLVTNNVYNILDIILTNSVGCFINLHACTTYIVQCRTTTYNVRRILNTYHIPHTYTHTCVAVTINVHLPICPI